MRIVALSDTHGFGKEITVPDGDVLIHAGDHTFRGTESELKAAFRWLAGLPHQHKLIIVGNHDWIIDPRAPREFRGWSLHRSCTRNEFIQRHLTDQGLTYLQDSGIEIDGVKFWGAPWQPYFYGWAFNFPDGPDGPEVARDTWAKIPDDTNVLITHTPPAGILDWVRDKWEDTRAGDSQLRERILDLKDLRAHIFGHLHESYGTQVTQSNDPQKPDDTIIYANVSICTRDYDPTNEPIVIDL